MKRLVSLDILRGFDMFFIVGGATLVMALCGAFGFGKECFLYRQMIHVRWHGLAFMDTIFPLFLFIAGASFPFSLAKQRESGRTTGEIVLKIAKRALVLVLLGMVYNGVLSSPDFAHARYPSVLARIGLGWAGAALLTVFLGVRARIGVAAAILVGYWALLRFVPSPDAAPGADPFALESCLANWVDSAVLPGGKFDPEGVLSTLPSVATGLLGVFSGEYLLRHRGADEGTRTTLVLLAVAAALVAAGLLGSAVFPINKKLWTSTFVLVVGGYSTAMLAAFHWMFDVKGWTKAGFFFKVIGMNSIAVYLFRRIVGFDGANKLLFGGLAGLFPPEVGAAVMAVGYLILVWGLLYLLYRKGIFFKV